MAHFAQLDENNIVLQVVVIGNDDILDDDGNESEAVGIAFCKSLFGDDTNWKQTSYNCNMRKVYAGINFLYDADRDAFYPPEDTKDFPSWTLNLETAMFEAPVPHPDGTGIGYDWDEENKQWVASPDPE